LAFGLFDDLSCFFELLLQHGCIYARATPICVDDCQRYEALSVQPLGKAIGDFPTSLDFRRHNEKIWNQWRQLKFPSVWAGGKMGVAEMAESMSLLDRCRESILRLAATQPPDGKRAISVLAEIFQANGGPGSYDGQPGQSQDFAAADRRPKPRRAA
jgi:hypothetical protein